MYFRHLRETKRLKFIETPVTIYAVENVARVIHPAGQELGVPAQVQESDPAWAIHETRNHHSLCKAGTDDDGADIVLEMECKSINK